MDLMTIFKKAYAGEKTAAAQPTSGEQLLNELLGKEAADDQNVKLAAAYDELGRRLAREAFAAEVLGQQETEKTGEATTDDTVLDSIMANITGEEAPAAEEKVAEKSGDEVDALIAAVTGEEAPAAEETKEAQDEAQLKLAAQVEIVEKLIVKAAAGNAAAKGVLGKVLKSAKGGMKSVSGAGRAAYDATKGAIKSLAAKTEGGVRALGEQLAAKKTQAVKAVKKHPVAAAGAAAGAGAGGGALATYMAMRRGKQEKK